LIREETTMSSFSLRLTHKIAALASSASLALHLPGREPLTRRERDVLAYLADGKTNKEAALRLGLSARTIEGHRANIMRKVGARNAAELVRRILSERDNPSTRWGGLAEVREA